MAACESNSVIHVSKYRKVFEAISKGQDEYKQHMVEEHYPRFGYARYTSDNNELIHKRKTLEHDDIKGKWVDRKTFIL